MENKGKEKAKCNQFLQYVSGGGKNWHLNKGAEVWGYRVSSLWENER